MPVPQLCGVLEPSRLILLSPPVQRLLEFSSYGLFLIPPLSRGCGVEVGGAREDARWLQIGRGREVGAVLGRKTEKREGNKESDLCIN